MEDLSRALSSDDRNARKSHPASRKRSSGVAVAAITMGIWLASGVGCGSSSSSTSGGSEIEEDAKALAGSKKEYVGDWSGPGTSLSISSQGDVIWKSDKDGTSSSYSGKLKKFKGDSLLIDAFVEVNLVVAKAPHEDGGAWKMTMEGIEVTRVDPVASIAKMLQEDLVKQGPAVKEMTCKGKAPVGEKSTLDCEIVSEDGTKAALNVLVTAEGDASTQAKPGEVMFFGGKVNDLFNSDIVPKVDVPGLKGGCPNAVYAKKIGESITCPALVGAEAHGTFTATAKENDGISLAYKP